VKRIAKILSFLLVAAAVSCVTAQAQTCADWLKVKGWKGNYSLSGVGTTTGNGGVITINQTSSANVNMTGNNTQCTGGLGWGPGTDPINVLLNDTIVWPCNPGQASDVLVGTGGGVSNSFLLIDVTNGTYSFFPVPQADWNQTDTNCVGNVVKNQGANYPMYPIQLNFPPTFPLPNSVQPLTVSNYTFPGTAGFEGGSATVPFTLNFTLTPIINDNDNVDDPCSKTGGSSIGCQNQSLGEDVPVVGTGFFLHYEGDRAAGRSGANGLATADAYMIGGWTLNVHHAYDPQGDTLFLGGGGQRSTWQLEGATTHNGNYLVTSQDGSEVYVFNLASERHLQTLKSLTGAVKYQFAYDPAGNLITITDGSGNVTTIQRDGSEHATSIVSPYAQTTVLSLDGNGFLSQVADPAGNTEKFTYNTSGLMATHTDANGNVSNYTYDSSGRLIKDSDPAGGFTNLSRADSNSGYTVTTTTALGRANTFQVTTGVAGEQLTNTWPNGLQATVTNLQQNGNISESTVLPDGTSDNNTMGPDPRWGIQVPIATSATLKRGSLTMKISNSRTASLGTPGDPFSLTTQTDTETINGRKYTSTFTAATKTFLDKTPAGRTTTTVLDALERFSSVQPTGLTLASFAYDTHGRLSAVQEGTRNTTLSYDADGRLASVTGPLNLTRSFTYDTAGDLLATTLEDGRVINYAYDANRNLTSVTPPGKSAHSFLYSVVNRPTSYTPPVVPGGGATTYLFSLDRELTKMTRPDGQAVNYNYDGARRISSAVTPSATLTFTYDSTTGNRSGAAVSGGEAIAYSYDGPLPTGSTWTGTVAGSIARSFNNNFWVTSQNINGANSVAFTYDKDGLTSKAGLLTLAHNAKTGLYTGSTLASAKDTIAYNTFAEPTTYTAKHLTAIQYKVIYTRDNMGRIAGLKETIGGATNSYAYTYDAAGRLTGVKKNGASTASYTYDSNSNRLSVTTPSGTTNGSYDAQDRLLTYGNASYAYSANGELATKTVGAQTTTYQYDVMGNLTAATLPNGTQIAYIVDAENNRVAKKANGVVVAGFLYDGGALVAQLDANNQIVSQFVYGSGSTAPDYIVAGGVTYRIFFDHRGSPRLVVNSSTGQIVEQIDYDEFGNVINDTNPGFQPFGFAGGLYDQDTKLVRFGMRDYDASAGRWTAKDPIRFAGGDTDLYGYVFADPINSIDPTGLECPKWIDDLIHKLTGDKVPTFIPGVTVATDKVEVSAGGSVGVRVGGNTVATVDGKVAVGVNSNGGASDPIFYVDGKVAISVPKVGSVEVVHVHKESNVVDQKSIETISKSSQASKADQCDPECK
jgi:RHS repeat-associated protein